MSNHHNGIFNDWLMFWLSINCVTRCCLVPEKTRQQNLPEASAIKCHQNTVGGLDNFTYVLELKTAEATFPRHFNFRWVVICETCLPVINTWEILHQLHDGSEENITLEIIFFMNTEKKHKLDEKKRNKVNKWTREHMYDQSTVRSCCKTAVCLVVCLKCGQPSCKAVRIRSDWCSCNQVQHVGSTRWET